MTLRRYVWLGALLLVTAVSGAVLGYLWHEHHGTSPNTTTPSGQAQGRPDCPVARVTTTSLRHGMISETLTVYGTVVPMPGKIHTYSVPYECRIRGVLVTRGQFVKSGNTLIEFSASPDALLQFGQIENELTAARTGVKLLKDRFELKLATREDLTTAQSRLHQLEQHLQNLKARGIDTKSEICAASEGIVYSIDGQAGQLLPAGSSLIQLVDKEQIAVNIGVESEDIEYLSEGQQVKLKSIHAPASQEVCGRIHTIAHSVDPSSRLVNVLIVPDVTGRLLFNDFIEVDITIAAREALVVPRSAVLPDDQVYTLFTIENGRALKHSVIIGVESSLEVQVIAEDLHEGDRVVTVGNYELSDGIMVVESK